MMALAVVAGGCGRHPGAASGADAGDAGADAADAAAWTGKRLVPWQLQPAGTAPLVVGIYDTKEKAHCQFLHDEAGQLRCLPTAFVEPTATAWFTDGTCTTRVYGVEALQGQALEGRPVALPLPRRSCEPRRHAVGTLKTRATDAARYGGTPCAVRSVPVDPLALLVDMEVGQVESPARWATGTEVDGPLLGGRLLLRQIETEEGTRFDDHFVDTHWSKPCKLENADGGDQCIPARLEDETFVHEDAACLGTPVWRAGACEAPAYIGRAEKPFHALGAPWTGDVFQRGLTCQPVGPQSTTEGPELFFELGAPLGDDATVGVRWRLGGAARFQLRGLQDDAGALLPVGDALARRDVTAPRDSFSTIVTRFHDTVANADCNPIWTEGGVRCVPTNVIVNPAMFYFADAACTTPADLCPTAQPCGGLPVIPFSIDARGERRADSLNETVAAPALYFPVGATCVARPDVTGYTLGAAVPWDRFPLLDEINGRASGAP
jgi:hypothetical protein